jgi:hypothetical protein
MVAARRFLNLSPTFRGLVTMARTGETRSPALRPARGAAGRAAGSDAWALALRRGRQIDSDRSVRGDPRAVEAGGHTTRSTAPCSSRAILNVSSRASAAASAARSRSVYAGASGSTVVDAPQSRRSYRTTWRPPRASAAQSASGQESMVVPPASRTSGAAASPKCSAPSVTPLASTVVMRPAPTQSRRWARGTTGPSDASSTSRTASWTGGAGSVADTLRVAASRACPAERRDPLAVAQMPVALDQPTEAALSGVMRSHASRRAIDDRDSCPPHLGRYRACAVRQ